MTIRTLTMHDVKLQRVRHLGVHVAAGLLSLGGLFLLGLRIALMTSDRKLKASREGSK